MKFHHFGACFCVFFTWMKRVWVTKVCVVKLRWYKVGCWKHWLASLLDGCIHSFLNVSQLLALMEVCFWWLGKGESCVMRWLCLKDCEFVFFLSWQVFKVRTLTETFV